MKITSIIVCIILVCIVKGDSSINRADVLCGSVNMTRVTKLVDLDYVYGLPQHYQFNQFPDMSIQFYLPFAQ